MISTPEWFPLELLVEVTDFVFEAINMRADGKRPSVQCLVACYMAMFGEYATMLQNHQKTLEEWLSVKTNWHHMWKDSIVQYDSEPVASPSSGELAGTKGFNIPHDLSQMTIQNRSFGSRSQNSSKRRPKIIKNDVPNPDPRL